MSDIVYSVKKKGDTDRYENTTDGSTNINTKIANFIQELVTDKGSCIFDKEYGTRFIRDIGEIVNIYKVDYLVKNNYHEVKDKHNVSFIEAVDVHFSQSDGFLNISLRVTIDNVVSIADTAISYTGSFTKNTIIEVEK